MPNIKKIMPKLRLETLNSPLMIPNLYNKGMIIKIIPQKMSAILAYLINFGDTIVKMLIRLKYEVNKHNIW
jgi:hypothetical protein